MYSTSRRDQRRSTNIWPGFVDALSTLLLVVIFLLMVFMVAQFFLSTALTGKDEELSDLDQQLIQLGELLALERSANAELRINITQLSSELQNTLAAKDDISNQLSDLQSEQASLTDQLSTLLAQKDSLAAQVNRLNLERETLRFDLGDRNARLAENDSQLSTMENDLSSLEDESQGLKKNILNLEDDLSKAAREMSDAEARELALKRRLATVRDELAAAFTTIQADKEKIEVQVTELAIMRELRDELDKQLATRERLLAALAAEKEQLEQDLSNSQTDQADLSARLANREAELTALANRLSSTEDFALEQQQRRAEAEQQAALALQSQKAAEQLAAQAQQDKNLSDEEKAAALRLSEQATRKLNLLNRQMASLRRQMASLNAALEASEARNSEQQVQIIDLGKRLNVALASKVQELARFRSEFFGRLRELLGANPNIEIVGDRFVFQAEVLFPSSQALLDPYGEEQIAELAQTLLDVSSKIPDDIDWVLRVDGHTDVRPIATSQFPSNWELSSARAIAVVKFLIAQGLPANRLVAAGFGEFQPIDSAENEIAYNRNRRIEFKLTTR
ncbi:peptidoglycan -binding protein [Rhodovibrionaceae bacterium A322]